MGIHQVIAEASKNSRIYFQPQGVLHYAAAGYLHKLARFVRSGTWDETISNLDRSRLEAFNTAMGAHRLVSQFYRKRRNLTEAHELVHILYSCPKSIQLGRQYNVRQRTKANQKRLEKLHRNGMILPYHFNGLGNAIQFFIRNNIAISDDICDHIEELNFEYRQLVHGFRMKP